MRNETPGVSEVAPSGAARELRSFAAWTIRWFLRRLIGPGGLLVVATALIAFAWVRMPQHWPYWAAIAIMFGAFQLAFVLIGYLRARAAIEQSALRQELHILADTVARARLEAHDRIDAFSEVAGRSFERAQADHARESEQRGRMAFALLEQRIAQLERSSQDPATPLELASLLQRLEVRVATSEDRLRAIDLHTPELNSLRNALGRMESSAKPITSRLSELEAVVRGISTTSLAAIEARIGAAEARFQALCSTHDTKITQLAGSIDQAVDMLQARLASTASEVKDWLRAETITHIETESNVNAERVQTAVTSLLQRLECMEQGAAKSLASARSEVESGYRAAIADISAALRQELEAAAARLGACAARQDAMDQELSNICAHLNTSTTTITEDMRTRLEEVRATLTSKMEEERGNAIYRADTIKASLATAEERLDNAMKTKFDEARTALLAAREDSVSAIATANSTTAILTSKIADLQESIAKRDATLTERIQIATNHVALALDKVTSHGAITQKAEADASKALADASKALADAQKATDAAARAHTMISRSSTANAGWVRPVERLLTSDKLARFEQHWLKVFGLNMTKSAIAYLAHQIATQEDRCEGRMAASMETAIIRQLALRSLPPGQLQVMEIGTLFGIGAASFYRFPGPRARGVKLTLLDPMSGYYEAGNSDPVSGVPVDRKTLERNFRSLNIPDSDWRLIQRPSTDPQALAEASDRLYDLILIDGDHSVDGVARDFELYGPLVKPGGIVLFDDYGNPHWPGIQPWVDEHARNAPGWVWVGGEYSTGILRRASNVTVQAPSHAARSPAKRRVARKVRSEPTQ